MWKLRMYVCCRGALSWLLSALMPTDVSFNKVFNKCKWPQVQTMQPFALALHWNHQNSTGSSRYLPWKLCQLVRETSQFTPTRNTHVLYILSLEEKARCMYTAYAGHQCEVSLIPRHSMGMRLCEVVREWGHMRWLGNEAVWGSMGTRLCEGAWDGAVWGSMGRGCVREHGMGLCEGAWDGAVWGSMGRGCVR